MTDEPVRPDVTHFEAVILDMDGVITDTAGVHEQAWKATFDRFLQERLGPGADEFTAADYREYVDGKPRYDGVDSFLRSRGIELPWGDPDDPPEAATVCGVGNRKNGMFLETLRERGPERYETTVTFIEDLLARGRKVAAISSSANAHEVLERAEVRHLFDAIVSGVESAELGLTGKPAPDIFLEAAQQVGVTPDRAVVVEDATSGVEAGRAGGFGLVIGVDRHGTGELVGRGADVAVSDLGDLLPLPTDDLPRLADLPRATDVLRDRDPGQLAIFLDYDGTLTSIVDDPASATLPAATREAIERLAGSVPVVIVSGRDLDDVRSLVDVDGIAWAGSHGFDIRHADGSTRQLAADHLDDLDAAAQALRGQLDDVPGAHVERKRFAIAVHDRQVADADDLDRIESVVRDEASRQPRLHMTGGKRIHELRPDIAWDKGRAIAALIDAMGLRERTPVYIGDDETDEDGFRAVKARGGLALVVRGEHDGRPTLADGVLASVDEAGTLLAGLADRVGGD